MSSLAFEKDLPQVLTTADNLPSLPAVALEVLRLAQDESSTIDELAACIGRDPALAAKLLKLSNSSLFGMGQEITSLQRATVVLGLKTVKLMSLSFSLATSIPTTGKEGGLDLPELWRRSLISAVAGRSLAGLVDSPLGAEGFLCGLLGHVGRLVLGRTLPTEYEEVIEHEGGWPALEAEERRLGFSNVDACATLLKTWNLPRMIYMAVGFAHRPDELPQDEPVEVLELARLMECTGLIERILCDENKGEPLARLHELAEERYGLTTEQVDSFLVALEPTISETAEMLDIRIPEGLTHEDVMNQARVQIVNVSLGTAADLQQARRRAEALEGENKNLEVAAQTDRLTGLANRAAFEDFLGAQIDERLAGRIPRALGVVMIDVDHFKSFNDTYGHQAGDEVLRRVGEVLKRHTRKGDLSARYGGEEFVVVAPYTNTFGIKTMAERLRGAIADERIEFEGQELSVTASLGAACIAAFQSPEDGKALVKLADHFLYKAKENGRNRCEIFPRVRFPGR